jgi:hypothetical protein
MYAAYAIYFDVMRLPARVAMNMTPYQGQLLCDLLLQGIDQYLVVSVLVSVRFHTGELQTEHRLALSSPSP